MKELIIISGKGGTGKTSMTAAIASLASRSGTAVFADCDVDAADLHLLFNPEVQEKREFISGHVARIDPLKCISTGQDGGCADCAALCRFDAISLSAAAGCVVEEGSCEGCGVCVRFCPAHAIDFPDRRCGEQYVSNTRFGVLVHAALDIRAENSGKLVTSVRKDAKRIAGEKNADWIIVDGSPGTGCPVIASITGADAALVVTEPTVSGLHDLERVASLAKHLGVRFFVAVNKADINPAQSDEIRSWCGRNSVPFLGTMPWDPSVTRAQIAGKSIIEYNPSCPASQAAASLWDALVAELQ